MATISIEQVQKIYPNGFEAIHSLDLEVAEGEFMVLVGPSGCGKTTALRMVAGLEDISAGTIRIGDRVVNDLSPKDRDIAMVFQNYSLYPHMTVAQNIGFALRVRKLSKDEIKTKVDATAELLGLSDWIDHKPGQLSGGQRQRVAMGRAIIREPSVFLMDEPLSNLDAQLRVQMRTEVLRIQRRLGVATLYVTHDQTEAMTMGDRVAVLKDGHLQQLALPQALYDRPANVFVASFMGSPAMNLYEASVSGPAENAKVSLGAQELQLPEELCRRKPALAGADRRGIIVGIRPESLTVPVDDAAPVEGCCLAVDVELVEALGNERLIHFATDASPVSGAMAHELAVDEVQESELMAGEGISGTPVANGVARVDPRGHVVAGERATLNVDVEALHFFDAETGAAIEEAAA
jgi:multiple sugar transport system ATP-binding protein